MGRPGRKRRLALEDESWKLIGDGVGTVEACRRLGIDRTTGYYWRAHRGGLAGSTLPRTPGRGGTYLCWSGSGSACCHLRVWVSARSLRG